MKKVVFYSKFYSDLWMESITLSINLICYYIKRTDGYVVEAYLYSHPKHAHALSQKSLETWQTSLRFVQFPYENKLNEI